MKGGCGFPMGPFALLDLVGLDTSLAILDALYDEFRDPNYAAVPLLRRMVAAELLRPEVGPGLLRLPQVADGPRCDRHTLSGGSRSAGAPGRTGPVPAGVRREWRGERRVASRRVAGTSPG